jgi:hypothetical protein
MKFKEFWEYVFAIVSKLPDRVVSLEGFTWWFASNKFDSLWLISNLKNVLAVAGKVESEDFVLDNLAPLSVAYPEESVAILEQILRSTSKAWLVHTSEKEVTEILRNARASSSLVAKEDAKRIINDLARKQNFGFLSLI